MWPDNEADIDFLNFSSVADTVAEIINQAAGRPISIGISGAWGVGKTSMLRLVERSLNELEGRPEGARKLLFVTFNAWLYQGYDDARAALMDVIAAQLEQEARAQNTGGDTVREFVKRVKWLRVAKMVTGSIVAMSLGLPPIGVIGELWGSGARLLDNPDAKDVADAEKAAERFGRETSELIKPRPATSPPQEIQELRDSFEAALDELGVTLVVFIDDLDRCLPETTISTLEAFRLFLFLKHTAFVIAADNGMIKYAMRRHFEDVEDETLVTNYFDKLIQVPIQVPPLGTHEVRAYMLLLFIENSSLVDAVKEDVREAVAAQLRQSWQGKRVDSNFVKGLGFDLAPDLADKLETADRLAPLMTSATGIAGNPRLIKRFLNALSIRMTISNAQGVGVDEAVLGKLLLFERLGSSGTYAKLTSQVTESVDGKPVFLKDWEEAAQAGEEFDLPQEWDIPFMKEWLGLRPSFHSVDLRGALYVSREQAPLITPEDKLSADAAEILTALLEQPQMADSLKERIGTLQKVEITVLMDRLLEQARRFQEWGTPDILDACLAVADVDQSSADRLSVFLSQRPAAQLRPSIVPKVADRPWSSDVFEQWFKAKGVRQTVKNAIKGQQGGNVKD